MRRVIQTNQTNRQTDTIEYLHGGKHSIITSMTEIPSEINKLPPWLIEMVNLS